MRVLMKSPDGFGRIRHQTSHLIDPPMLEIVIRHIRFHEAFELVEFISGEVVLFDLEVFYLFMQLPSLVLVKHLTKVVHKQCLELKLLFQKYLKRPLFHSLSHSVLDRSFLVDDGILLFLVSDCLHLIVEDI